MTSSFPLDVNAGGSSVPVYVLLLKQTKHYTHPSAGEDSHLSMGGMATLIVAQYLIYLDRISFDIHDGSILVRYAMVQ